MTRKLTVLVALLVLAFVISSKPAKAAPLAPQLEIVVTPTELVPAQAGMVMVTGGYPLDIVVTLDGQPLDVFWADDGYVAAFSFGFDESPGFHTIETQVVDPLSGAELSQTDMIEVIEFTYQRESLAISIPLLPLLEEDVNLNEDERLKEIYAIQPAQAGLDWPFVQPLPGTRIQARFGNERSYNAGVWRSNHDGVDFQSTFGDPVFAAASGIVIAADMFDIRGNLIIIDHGNGIQSGYAHLREINVSVGDYVRQGQLIGQVGSTGRSEGPHLHFMIIVNGNVVDPIRWMEIIPGYIPPRELFG